MHRKSAFFFIFFIFLVGCNRPNPHPESLDPIYADIQNQIASTQKEAELLEKELAPIMKDIKEAQPQTGELKLRYSELYETQSKLAKAKQRIDYLNMRLATRKQLVKSEYLKAFEKGELSAGDIKPIVTASYANAPTRLINKLIDKKMLRKQKEAGRKYLPSINNNYLLRGFVESLRKNQFIAFKE
jgi:predicted nuclease with TOPRIM domain